MAFPNISDILATTIENRSKKVADNVTNNNAILKKMSMKGNMKSFSGGHKIIQELSFAENANFGWYSGYDTLPVGVSDVISAAEYDIKQCAAPVVMSGLEMLQNASKEKMIDLMDTRLSIAEKTMANQMSIGLYSDGSGASGKQIDGLDAAIVATGTYGGIDRASWTFWQPYVLTQTSTANNIQNQFNTMWSNLVRGSDRPDLIMLDNNLWILYVESLQSAQRFMSPETGALGFPTLKYMDADVCLDGGIGGACPISTSFWLNSDYIHYRPHSKRNMVPLSPNRRYSTNQDAEVQIMAWAGNLTMSGSKFQGRLNGA